MTNEEMKKLATEAKPTSLMQVWMRESDGQIFLAVPQLFPIDKHAELMSAEVDENNIEWRMYYGSFLQEGWMIQNRYSVFFGIPLSAHAEFEYIGDL